MEGSQEGQAVTRHVIMFSPRFASPVLAGTKRQTIRPPRKRPIKVGDILSLREWTGAPYRSPQRTLREATAIHVEDILIDPCGILLGDIPVSNCITFAKADGFFGWGDMMEWFRPDDGWPFRGICIQWDLTP